MNIERMKKLADHLRNLDSSSQMGFDMDGWYDEDALDWRGEECKSVACIAGHAVGLFGSINIRMTNLAIRDMAQKHLDFTNRQADELFTPFLPPVSSWQYTRRRVSPEDAANALERMIKGKKPWI